MQLIIRLVMRLVAVVALCLALTIGWVMIDAHRASAAETAASAERVAHELENLFWREILWRGSMRRDKSAADSQLGVARHPEARFPGRLHHLRAGGERSRAACAAGWRASASPRRNGSQRTYEALFGAARPSLARAHRAGAGDRRRRRERGASAAVRQAWRQISIVAASRLHGGRRFACSPPSRSSMRSRRPQHRRRAASA